MKTKTVKDAKQDLKELINQLEKYPEDYKFNLTFADNSGGFYPGYIADFNIELNNHNDVDMYNI